jgi:hypothetical protein
MFKPHRVQVSESERIKKREVKMKLKFMSLEPYQVIGNGPAGAKICLSKYLQAEPGDKYFQAIQPNGVIMLIPEALEKEYRKKD